MRRSFDSEEFGKGNDFCQKITSKSTGKKPDDLLSEFRNSYFPRIAVTVDMIATGTDVKPLECLIFMRNIRSLGYFEQMKGRGCRVVDPDVLQSVTPDAKHKTHFVIVDAVGVCEDEDVVPAARRVQVSVVSQTFKSVQWSLRRYVGSQSSFKVCTARPATESQVRRRNLDHEVG